MVMAIDPNERWASVQITETPVVSRRERLLGRYADERAWRKRALGERATGLWLGRLPEGWFAFHDVPVGERGANIDHLVIGPGGVFTINTKDLTGAIRVSRRTITHGSRRTAFLPKAVAEATRAARLLSRAIGREVSVRPVLAILADEWTVTAEPDDVIVRGPRAAKNVMLAQPTVLRRSDVIVLAAAAAKPETWTPAIRPTAAS
jgi:hypothetical protein